ncbi:MAG TPA: chitinase, partial [Phycisphaerae bacterium]|nr:chitinase [Phycisphaerae bacterium]
TTLDVPAPAGNPSPGNGATGVSSASPTLSWGAVATATGYDVWFNGVQVSTNQPGTSFLPGALAANTMYTWRVDPKNAAGTTTGVTWSFTTAP